MYGVRNTVAVNDLKKAIQVICLTISFLLPSLMVGATDCPTIPGCPDCGYYYWHPEAMMKTFLYTETFVDNPRTPPQTGVYIHGHIGFISFWWPPYYDSLPFVTTPNFPERRSPHDLLILDCSLEPENGGKIGCAWLEGTLVHYGPYPKGVVSMYVNDISGEDFHNYVGWIDFDAGKGVYLFEAGAPNCYHTEIGHLFEVLDFPVNEYIMKGWLREIMFWTNTPLKYLR